MSNPSKDKGTRAEILVRDILRKITGLGWERTPLSGALDPKHGLKSDLYVPNEHNLYCVEVKHYSSCHIDHTLITSKSPQLIAWVEQAIRQGTQVAKKPLLIFKHDRSKIFCAFLEMPESGYPYIFVDKNGYNFYISLLDDFLLFNKPLFIK